MKILDILGYFSLAFIAFYCFAAVMVVIGFATRDDFWFGITKNNRRPGVK